jgi:hypothetical protein
MLQNRSLMIKQALRDIEISEQPLKHSTHDVAKYFAALWWHVCKHGLLEGAHDTVAASDTATSIEAKRMSSRLLPDWPKHDGRARLQHADLIPVAFEREILVRLPLLWPLWWIVTRSQVPPNQDPVALLTSEVLLSFLYNLDCGTAFDVEFLHAPCRWMVLLSPLVSESLLRRHSGDCAFLRSLLSSTCRAKGLLDVVKCTRVASIAVEREFMKMHNHVASSDAPSGKGTHQVHLVAELPSGPLCCATTVLETSVAITDVERGVAALTQLQQAFTTYHTSSPAQYTGRVLVALMHNTLSPQEAISWAAGLLALYKQLSSLKVDPFPALPMSSVAAILDMESIHLHLQSLMTFICRDTTIA